MIQTSEESTSKEETAENEAGETERSLVWPVARFSLTRRIHFQENPER